MARSKFEIIVDAGVALGTDWKFLLVVATFGGTAIWGQELVAELFGMVGDLISRARN